MIKRILAGTATADDVEEARAYSFDDRKKLMERLLGSLGESFDEALRLDAAVEDVANALRQARPVFAAGLPVDQALGFIVKLIDESMENLVEAGEGDSDEYEKQELVKETLEGFIEACNEAGTTQGEEAQETAHLEYRGEVGKLEALKTKTESEIANSLAFLKDAYGEGKELSAFLKAIDRDMVAARYIGAFGSPSFFANKHVAAPGETFDGADADSESD